MGCSTIVPSPHQPHWTSYVYYVVMLCPCGHSYYYPSRKQILLDEVTPEKLVEEINSIPQRIDTHCSQCGKSAEATHARRAVVGYGMPDRSGCILCDFVIEEGETKRIRFRFDATSDPIQYFREHPDYFRTRPPDGSPDFIDDELCIEELNRVLSVRSSWNAVLYDALDHGAAFRKVQDGYYIFATTTQNSVEVECQMRELADEDFWYHFQNETIPRRRLLGIERWSEKQRESAGLTDGIYSEWLDEEVVKALQEQRVHAMAFTIDSIALQRCANAADHFGVSIDEIIPQDGGDPQWWMTTHTGISRKFPPLELLQLTAIYKGRLLSDQIWTTFEQLMKSINREERVFERFSHRLPPGYSAQWTDPGKLLIRNKDNPLELLTFAHIADNVEPTDDEALGRLVSWLVSHKSCECNRYVGKRLMSKSRFQECSHELLQDPAAFVFRERGDDLVEIYTDECEHHVIYGLRTVNGDVERAEALFQRDLPVQRYSLRYVTRKGFLRGVQMVALMGRDAASIAAHPALLKGVLSDLKIRFGDRVKIFAPFNGIITIGSADMDESKLEKFAYDVARDMPEQPELKSDHLSYHGMLELADEPLGQFELEAHQTHSTRS